MTLPDAPHSEPLSGPLVWQARDLNESDWRYVIDDTCLAEIDAAVAELRKAPVPAQDLSADDFDMPACRALMARVKEGLADGCGFALVDRLPMDRLSKDEATAIYHGLLQVFVSKSHDMCKTGGHASQIGRLHI